MSKAHVTRTFGPIHFEDLDPHRFEDLIREIIYDFKDWQTIEATGRSGSDGGFDIRAFERTNAVPASMIDEGDEVDVDQDHPMVGNRWMVQCKREKTIGPTKLKRILAEIDETEPPYGYILAASATFSKQSYDVFRSTLLEKGVSEFYLWGNPELEDMLHLPKNDRILFAFFGISLVSRRRSRTTEIRASITNKNKIFRVFGDAVSGFNPVLLRDSKDTHYPYKNNYSNFAVRPRWKEYFLDEYHPLGIILNIAKYFAFIDTQKKQYDFAPSCDLLMRTQSQTSKKEQFELRERIEDFWTYLPLDNQAKYSSYGLVKFDAMLAIDSKGNVPHKFPHIYVDFDVDRGPFTNFYESFEADAGVQLHEWNRDDWEHVKIFPDEFPQPKIGKVHQDRVLKLDPNALRVFEIGDGKSRYFDIDQNYSFLEQRDVIALQDATVEAGSRMYAEITNKQRIEFETYIGQTNNPEYWRTEISRRAGRELKANEKISILELRRTYPWKFQPES